LLLIYDNNLKVHELTEEILEAIFDELIRIRRTLEFMIEDRFKIYLSEVASSPERQRIWMLLDGLTSTTDIADTLGITQRSVQRFVKILGNHNLVDLRRRGYPKRNINYTPQEWLDSE
jgi:DNA-binding transcriptional ArsR family regulator